MATQGYIDGITKGWVHGWALDPDQPLERIELEVHFDGSPVGRCVADRHRPDLEARGIGDGRHGFQIELPKQLEPGSAHSILIHPVGTTNVLPLAEGYLTGEAGVSLAIEVREPQIEASIKLTEALVGPDSWLFPYAQEERFARAVGARPDPPPVVDERVNFLRRRYDRLAASGIDYLVATVPHKAVVYPERLEGAQIDPEATPAVLLAAALRVDPHLELLDLRPVLRDARRFGRVFSRTGHGLTWTGAFHCYRAVVKELAKRHSGLEPLPISKLALDGLVPIPDPPHSLRLRALDGRSVAVGEIDSDELEPDLDRETLTSSLRQSPEPIPLLSREGQVFQRTVGQLGTVVLVHEPGLERLAPFLAEHATLLISEVSSSLPVELIEQLDPTVVIQLMAEDGGFFA
jgi:hypothetical protein